MLWGGAPLALAEEAQKEAADKTEAKSPPIPADKDIIENLEILEMMEMLQEMEMLQDYYIFAEEGSDEKEN